jgi:hypothetical protein
MFGDCSRRLALVTAAATAVVVAALPAFAQETSDPADIKLPGISSFAPATEEGPLAIMGGSQVTMAAQLTGEAVDISRGLVWRVFRPEPGPDGKLPLMASAQGGTAVFELAPGSYLVHASFGRAGATKRITVGREAKRESLVLDAGGLKLDAILTNGRRIPAAKLRFSIFEASGEDDGGAEIARDVKPNTVIRLNAGTYHVVSNYGNVNAVIRSNITVEAGKLIEATVEHQAAEITVKLVRETGGEAIADTSWSIVSASGEPIRDSVGAYASLVLTEGEYVIIAKNRDRIYQRTYTVEAGVDQEVELITSQTLLDPSEVEGDAVGAEFPD